jgi:hypothetical protein
MIVTVADLRATLATFHDDARVFVEFAAVADDANGEWAVERIDSGTDAGGRWVVVQIR